MNADPVNLWYTFGKERYSRNDEMYAWCLDNIGPGGWSYGTPKTWEGMGDQIWIMHSMFGNTTFAFKEPAHFLLFLLRYGS